MPKKRRADPSVWDEPHLRPAKASGEAFDGSDRSGVDPSVSAPVVPTVSEQDRAMHSVHNELAMFPVAAETTSPETVPEVGAGAAVIDREWPCAACGYDLRGSRPGEPCPECGYVQFSQPAALDKPGYAQWLQTQIANTPSARRWAVLFAAVLTGGLLSVVGTFLSQQAYGLSVGFVEAVSIVFIGPTVEEMMKIGLALLVVEARPAWFASTRSIWVATIASALGFAAIENAIYLNIYVPNPPAWLIGWRWSVCVALHVSATAIATIGLAKMWRGGIRRLAPPRAADLYPFVVMAIVVHGAYNALAIGLELAGMI